MSAAKEVTVSVEDDLAAALHSWKDEKMNFIECFFGDTYELK